MLIPCARTEGAIPLQGLARLLGQHLGCKQIVLPPPLIPSHCLRACARLQCALYFSFYYFLFLLVIVTPINRNVFARRSLGKLALSFPISGIDAPCIF